MTFCRVILVLRSIDLTVWWSKVYKGSAELLSAEFNPHSTLLLESNQGFSTHQIWLRCDMIESNCSCLPTSLCPMVKHQTCLCLRWRWLVTLLLGTQKYCFFFPQRIIFPGPKLCIKHLKCHSHKNSNVSVSTVSRLALPAWCLQCSVSFAHTYESLILFCRRFTTAYFYNVNTFSLSSQAEGHQPFLCLSFPSLPKVQKCSVTF